MTEGKDPQDEKPKPPLPEPDPDALFDLFKEKKEPGKADEVAPEGEEE